jgi:hypothetical protein
MATNGTLQLATNYIQTGLGTLTYTVPTTVPPNGIATVNIPFTVQCQVTFPQSVGEGFGSGSGADQGLGVLGGVQGIGQGSNLNLGNGGLGLGFGGSATDGASGSGSGYGAGAGGGTLGGFSLGGGGLGDGAKGEGFGSPSSGYNQPLNVTNIPTSFAGILSTLSVVVNQNGSPVYTAPAIEGIQSALQFSTNLLCNANDSITIVFSSALASDEALNAIKANVSIGIGEQ